MVKRLKRASKKNTVGEIVKRLKRASKKKRISLSKKSGRKKGIKAGLLKELKSGKQLWATYGSRSGKWLVGKSKNARTGRFGYTPPPPPPKP